MAKYLMTLSARANDEVVVKSVKLDAAHMETVGQNVSKVLLTEFDFIAGADSVNISIDKLKE